jgi:carbonic anhydrase/acetyltransferase-like protein (isoleucine patch superfamily)
MIHENGVTDFCPKAFSPQIQSTAFVHPLAAVIGHVVIGGRVFVAPFASIRGDEGHPLHVGDEANVQDGVVIHALVTERRGKRTEDNLVTVGGKKYAVYIGNRVSLAHQAQIHGPAFVGEGTFVGMKALVFKASVGKNCVLEPGCLLMGVRIEDGRYVPAGTVVREQAQADKMPVITDQYPLSGMNEKVVNVNTRLAEGYHRMKP